MLLIPPLYYSQRINAMHCKFCLLQLLAVCLTLLSVADTIATEPTETTARVSDGFDFPTSDWPWWRGPLRNGTADASQTPPLQFGVEQNVVWRAQVPGRGHGSAAVVGNRVFLATSDEEQGSQSVLCFDRETGQQVWHAVVHASGAMQKNKKASAASSTPACDGERIYICFPNSNALVATALSMDGKVVWQREISKYVVHQGYGASPALYQDLVIVSADNKSGGAVMALNRKTGQPAWRRERPNKPNYPSPTLLSVDGKDQLIMVGCDQIVSYDPLTGKTLWEVEGATTECVTSTLTDGQLIYTSGGYPTNHMSAIRADGSGELVWENKNRLYVPSLVIKDGYLYGVLDAGIAMCWRAADGKEMWKARLGGTFSSSPVLVGDQIYISNEDGGFFVFRADPAQFEELAHNQLGTQVFATPTICGGHIYHRFTIRSEAGERQEWLYCFGT